MVTMLARALRGVSRRPARLNAAATAWFSGYSASDTIYALSSAQGKAGVAVVRISGDKADTCLQRLSKTSRLPNARMCGLRLASAVALYQLI